MVASHILAVLSRGLWHTTSTSKYHAILKTGEILPNPPIPESERWKTSSGPCNFPFVRTLDGVSLFDFVGFVPELYDRNFPMSSWRTFVPFRKDWGASVWIEIDRDLVRQNLLSANKLKQMQVDRAAQRHTLMPQIEVAQMGPLPTSAFKRTLICSNAKEGLVAYDA